MAWMAVIESRDLESQCDGEEDGEGLARVRVEGQVVVRHMCACHLARFRSPATRSAHYQQCCLSNHLYLALVQNSTT